jgi:hypothetical protein
MCPDCVSQLFRLDRSRVLNLRKTSETSLYHWKLIIIILLILIMNIKFLLLLGLGYYFVFGKQSGPSSQQLKTGAKTAAGVVEGVYKQATKASSR